MTLRPAMTLRQLRNLALDDDGWLGSRPGHISPDKVHMALIE